MAACGNSVGFFDLLKPAHACHDRIELTVGHEPQQIRKICRPFWRDTCNHATSSTQRASEICGDKHDDSRVRSEGKAELSVDITDRIEYDIELRRRLFTR